MAGLTDHLDMTIAVDWDVKAQTKQTFRVPVSVTLLQEQDHSAGIRKFRIDQDFLD